MRCEGLTSAAELNGSLGRVAVHELGAGEGVVGRARLAVARGNRARQKFLNIAVNAF